VTPSGGGRSKRDSKDVKRKKGGGKAPTSKSGTPRSKSKTKAKDTPMQAAKKRAKKSSKKKAKRPAVAARSEAKKADAAGRKPGERDTTAKERRNRDRSRTAGQKAATRAPASNRRSGAADADSQPLSRVGVVVYLNRGEAVEPIFGPGPTRALDSRGSRGKSYREGDLVFLAPADRDRSGRARVEHKIGRIDKAKDVLEALMLDRGLTRGFSAQVEDEAQRVSETISAEGRVDLRDLVTFTVDPKTARDFDDAISAEEIEGGKQRIWVHIADVSAFVRPGSALDDEAIRRSTSVYVPGSVEPMLPHSLSSGACSLVPGKDRLAVTVRMDFDGAKCVEAEVMRSIINSDQRLDYDEVDRIFLGEIAAREPWAAPLDIARGVSARILEARGKNHAITIDRPEPEFEFDRQGNASGWRQSEQTESHKLIEMLMVAANSEVAKKLVEAKIPALHRVHERPSPESVDLLLDRLETLDIPTPVSPDQSNPAECVRIVAEASVMVDHWTRTEQRGRLGITTLVLRALQQARYDREPLGHSGLGLEHYCHFTSPIRRYPDIVCHRAILSTLGLEDPPAPGEIGQLGEWTSAKEREAMVIERDADDIVSCFLLERELKKVGSDMVFDGEIVGVIGAGMFIDFGGGFEGFLPVRRMRNGWWDLNPEGTMLIADNGKRLRLGDKVKVEVARVETARGRCDLYLAENSN
jgi:ribonuclease R